MQIKDLEDDDRAILEQAIRSMQLGKRLNIEYHGEGRIVEVHAVGLSSRGKPCMRVYQVGKGEVLLPGAAFDPKNWRLLSLSDVESIHLLDSDSEGPRPGFKPNDKGMGTIFAEISNVEVPYPNPKP